MRIVFYSYSTTLYGAPTSLLNLIQGLTEKDGALKIYVVVPSDGPLVQELKRLPITVMKIPFARWIYKTAMYKNKEKVSPVLAKLWFFKNLVSKLFLNIFWLPIHLVQVYRIRPDIIYTNSSMSPMGPVVAKFLGILSVWHHRETINDPATDFFLEWPANISKRILNWPQIHIHPSSFLKQTYKPYVNSGESFVVFNGVEPTSGSTREVRKSKFPVFGMVGRLNIQKGQAEIVNIFSKVPNAVLNLYGTAEKSYLDRLKGMAVSNVHFRGYHPQDIIYREIDFLIVNARNESFGRVVAEAFAYGIPVFALRSGALPEIVQDGKTGFLFKDMDELGKLVESVFEVYSNGVYRAMQNCCKETFENMFSIQKYSSSIYKILHSAVGSAGKTEELKKTAHRR